MILELGPPSPAAGTTSPRAPSTGEQAPTTVGTARRCCVGRGRLRGRRQRRSRGQCTSEQHRIHRPGGQRTRTGEPRVGPVAGERRRGPPVRPAPYARGDKRGLKHPRQSRSVQGASTRQCSPSGAAAGGSLVGAAWFTCRGSALGRGRAPPHTDLIGGRRVSSMSDCASAERLMLTGHRSEPRRIDTSMCPSVVHWRGSSTSLPGVSV